MEWKTVKIGDVCRIKHGFAFKSVFFADTPQKHVLVTPGNFTTKGGFKNDKPKFYNGPIPDDYILKEDDLIVTMTDLSKDGDTLGYSALIPQDNRFIFLHNQRIGLVTDISKEIDKHFLYWVMRTYEYQRYIVGHCSGSTVKHTSPSGICSYSFNCPNISTQGHIAKVLDELEAKIENNNRINANLEAQAQALFKSWFVDFEPWGGIMPEDWKGIILGEVCNIKYGKGLSTNLLTDNGYPVFGGNGVIGYYSKFLYELPQILVSCRGAASGKIMESDPQSFVTSNSLVLEMNDRAYYYYLKYMLLANPLYNYATGSAQPQITIDNIKDVVVLLPSIDVVNRISEKYAVIDEQIRSLRKENQRLAALRDTLLPKLMKGEIVL